MVTYMFEKIQKNFIQFIINKPKVTLLIGIIIFLSFGIGATYIQSNFSAKIWFDDEYPAMQDLDNFEKRFGGDQFIAVGFYTDKKEGLFTEENLQLISELTEELWLLPDIIRVDTISNFNHIKADGNDINIVPLLDDPIDPVQVKKNISENSDIKNFLISEDLKFTFLNAQVKPLFGDSPNYTKVMIKLKEILKKYEREDRRFILMGNVVVTYAFREITKTDNQKTIPFMFGFILIILVLYFRSVAGVITPLIISLITIISTFGVMGHFGFVFNSILAAAPGILLAICLADTVHIMSTFYYHYYNGLKLKEALEYSLNKNFLATILTTLTTSVSFFTISFTDLIPIHDLGILSGIGTIFAWLFTFLFLPPLFLIFPEKMVKKMWSEKPSKSAEESRFSSLIWNFKFPIVFAFIALSIWSFITAMDNQVNSDPLKYFAKDTQIKKDYDFTKSFFKGIRGIELEVDSGKADGIKDPEFLKVVDSFIKELNIQEDIIQINSIIDIIKKVNKQLNSGKEEKFIIPQSKEEVAESLLLYTMGLPPNQGIEDLVSLDNRYIRLKIKWSLENSKESMDKDELIHIIAKKYNLKTLTGGFFPIYASVNNMVVDSFFKSMTMAILLVSIIILIVFRNPFLAFLAMLPNIIPLAFGAAYMALNNIYIDIGTSIVSAICLGIAVDDTIHFVTHFVLNQKKYGDSFKALNETFLSTGKALILTTALLVVGFGSFVMADFLPNHYFGILCAIVLTFALLTDLLFLPALLTIWYRKDKLK
jgi:predicted RND superfamily exporter protein